MRKLGLLVVAALVLGCGGRFEAQRGTMEIALDEFYIEPETPLVGAGSIDFELQNEGEIPHTLVVATNDGTVLAASDAVQPLSQQTLTVRLQPGTYQLTCRIVFRGDDGLLVDHYQEGMGTILTVEP
ncbi:MAG TPA: cupredoxin domain-containing protein [Acidimicrobiia bacterium]|nr:cupredoxin domain-containing protein [Acidimicrobiia bacterium]